MGLLAFSWGPVALHLLWGQESWAGSPSRWLLKSSKEGQYEDETHHHAPVQATSPSDVFSLLRLLIPDWVELPSSSSPSPPSPTLPLGGSLSLV